MKAPESVARIVRWRDEIAAESERSASEPIVGAPSLLATTTRLGVYPTSPQSFFACKTLTLLGQESEGGSGTLLEGVDPFLAFNLGSSLPPLGSKVLVTFTGSRWVFRYDA